VVPVAGPPVVPPSYPPRRELRDQRTPATPAPPRRTSTTTGIRVGRLTWPFIALALLLIALLGAALANAITRADGVPGGSTTRGVLAVAERDPHAERPGYPRAGTEDGMIAVRVPSSSGTLTTTKDS
jgi:serine/threonine-protein kinase